MNIELENAILNCLAETRTQMDEKDLAEFINTPTDEVTAAYHFGLGLYLRNNALKPDSAIFELFIREGFSHKDDMSSWMMELWHRELNKKQRRSAPFSRAPINN